MQSPSERVFFVLVLGCLLGAARAEAATGASGQSAAAGQALDCVESTQRTGQVIDWDQVCSTVDPNRYDLNRRSQVISESLDQAQKIRAAVGKSAEGEVVRPPSAERGPRRETSGEAPLARNGRNPSRFFPGRDPWRSFEMGWEISRDRYAEPGVMKQKGTKQGIFLNYTLRTQENQKLQNIRDAYSQTSTINMFRFEGQYSFGEMDYKSERTGEDSGIKDYKLEMRGLAGYDLPWSDSLLFTPYMGFGYRYLNDGLGGHVTTTGHWGYERESRYYYIPLGLETTRDIGSRWACRLTLEYDFFLLGHQTSHFEDGDPLYAPVKNEQREGYGVRGIFRLTYQGERLDVFVEPFVRYWSLKDSKISATMYAGAVDGYGIEPENNTSEYGLRFGARY